jgi:hypothetical protein
VACIRAPHGDNDAPRVVLVAVQSDKVEAGLEPSLGVWGAGMAYWEVSHTIDAMWPAYQEAIFS